MTNKMLSLMVECEGCGMKFRISSDETVGHLQYKKEYQVKGQSIFLTYYDCPSCGRRHFVQIDDERSLDLLDVNKKQFVHNASIRSKGQKLRRKKIDQYKDTRKHLADYRRTLMEQFAGTELYDEEKGSKFELRFSV